MIINLTPHTVTVHTNTRQISIPGTKNPARVRMKRLLDRTIDGVDIYKEVVERIENLPRPKNGVVYIVSSMTYYAAYESGRRDLVIPDGRNYTLLSRSYT